MFKSLRRIASVALLAAIGFHASTTDLEANPIVSDLIPLNAAPKPPEPKGDDATQGESGNTAALLAIGLILFPPIRRNP